MSDDQPPVRLAAKRGRIPNAVKKLRKLAAAGDKSLPEGIDYASLEDPNGYIEAESAEEKMYEISRRVAARLENVGVSAAARFLAGDDNGADLSKARPWANSKSSEDVIYAAEAHLFANDRLVSGLTAHLVEHLVIRDDLLSVIRSARRRLGDEMHGIPRYLAIFATRLQAAGVTANDVTNMSKRRLDEVVALIKRNPILSDGPLHERAGGASDLARRAENAAADADGPVEMVRPEDSASTQSVTNSGDPMHGGLDAFDDMHSGAQEDIEGPAGGCGPAAPPWDLLDVAPLGYRLVERVASTDEEMTALGYALPQLSSLDDLALPGSALERGFLERGRRGVDMSQGRALLDRWAKRANVTLSTEETMVWLLLLLALPDAGLAREKLPAGTFHELLLPGRTGRGNKVRQLLSLDTSLIPEGVGFRSSFATRKARWGAN